jgi:pilus assembly protein CpaB
MAIAHRGRTLLAVALLLGIAAAGAGYYSLRSLSARAAIQQDGEFRDVVVTSTDLSYGVRLERSMLRVVRYPKDAVPSGAYATVDSVQGQTTKVFMSAREPVTSLKLSSRGGGLSMLVRPNMRAASVEVNQVSGVSGFVLPGDRVDVLSTIDTHRDGQYAVTRTLIQNVEVLAAGQKTQQGETKPLTVQSVTLLVDPRGAEKLAHAQHEGEIHLVLRNPEDQSQAEVAAFSTRDMLEQGGPPLAVGRRAYRAPVASPPSAAFVRDVSSQRPSNVRIIRSADVVETPAVIDSVSH